MKRFALYARYSSDLQSDQSIEDQFRACEKFVRQQDGLIVGQYFDRAMSGASRHRPQYLRMLEDAEAGGFTHIVAEALDRLSRDQEDLASLYKHLNFHGVTLVTLAEGIINELHVGLKGTMNALFLKDLALKTRRGLEGRIKEGKSAGGCAYGYDVLRDFDSQGQPMTGVLRINQTEADIVQRIFIEFSEGKSPRAIARDLNRDGLLGPRNTRWVDTAIRGHPKKGTGILNNERYIGRLVWNRQRFIKDPKTGKRVSRLNPNHMWVIQEVPQLRIISDNLWHSVKARQEIIAEMAPVQCSKNIMTGARRLHYLLSGLLICGDCGGGYTLIGKDRYGCANHRNRGTCTNNATIKRQIIESRVLSGLKDRLLEPHYLHKFLDAYMFEWEKLEAAGIQGQTEAQKQLKLIEKKLDGIVRAIEQGVITETTQSRLIQLESERDTLRQSLSPSAPLPKPDPKMIDVYRQKVTELSHALYDPKCHYPAIDALKPLINKVILKPTNFKNKMRAELYGDITGLVRFNQEEGTDFFDPKSQISVVAGARNPLEDCIFGKLVAGARNQLSHSGQAIVIAGNPKSLRFDCLERSMGHRVNASKVVRRLARS